VDVYTKLYEIGEHTSGPKLIFKDIKAPYIVLGQELCKMLLTSEGTIVKRSRTFKSINI
jgi:hypothetical protein